jgi:hypothetical protein
MYTKGQHQKRRQDTFRDQHGRLWQGNIEIATGDPCEALAPAGWTAPAAPSWAAGALLPPEDCRDMVPIQERNVRGHQVRVNYQKWLAQHDAATDARMRKIHAFAMGMAGGQNVEQLIENPTPALREIVGPPPFPPRAMIEAAAAGNAWALGLTEDVPVKAEAALAEIKPLVTQKRRTADQAVDPFADEDDSPAVAALEAFAPLVPDPFATDEPSVQPRKRK